MWPAHSISLLAALIIGACAAPKESVSPPSPMLASREVAAALDDYRAALGSTGRGAFAVSMNGAESAHIVCAGDDCGAVLPKTHAAGLSSQEDPLVVGLTKDGRIYLNDNPIALADLRGKLVAIGQASPDRALLLRADRSVPYGDVVGVIAAIKDAGINRLGMVTEPAPDAPLSRPAGGRRR